MNVFGSFSFGNLIKTFLPGFVWLCVFALVEVYIYGDESWIITKLPSQETSVYILIIPLAILVGLISNIAVFMCINNWLIRDPFKKNNPDLWGLYLTLCDQWITQCCTRIKCDEKKLLAYKKHIDAEIILLHAIGIEEISYVREQYWYYLEFCLNLMLSLLCLLAVLIAVATTTFGTQLWGWPIVLSSAVLSGLCILLFCAARVNYARHVQKMVSLLAAALPELDGNDSVSKKIAEIFRITTI